MCLYIVKDKIPKNIKYAYKIFKYDIHNKELCSLYNYYSFTLNEWNCDILPKTYNKITADDGNIYVLGFHCWTNKKKAISYYNNCRVRYGFKLKLYKVEVKDVVAYGEQVEQNVIVCKQIKILDQIK